MKYKFERNFDECPVCALKRWLIEALETKDEPPEKGIGFFRELGKEIVERGLTRPEWTFNLEVKQGIVMDEQKVATIMAGTELPTFVYKTDICKVCGCVYANHIARGDTTVEAKPRVAAPPNRAMRRRLERVG